MGNEASKTRAIWDSKTLALFHGEGLDIGCGSDPVFPSADRFDREQGDANQIRAYVQKQYDYVFGSHVLEHMQDPQSALQQWFSLVKPGGHLIILVPDEDLYEQGVLPSLFNSDHKHTFTISKARSWSPLSVNVLDLARTLDGDLVSLELHDHGYDRRLLRQPPSRYRLVLLCIWRRLTRSRMLRSRSTLLNRVFITLGAVVDQTALPGARLAQIQLIVRKHGGSSK